MNVWINLFVFLLAVTAGGFLAVGLSFAVIKWLNESGRTVLYHYIPGRKVAACLAIGIALFASIFIFL